MQTVFYKATFLFYITLFFIPRQAVPEHMTMTKFASLNYSFSEPAMSV